MVFAVLLFVVLITICFFAAFMPQNIADTLIYTSWWFRSLLALLSAATLWCVIKRVMQSKKNALLSKTILPSLLFHTGVCILAAGVLCSFLFKKTGTVFLVPDSPLSVAFDGTKKIQLPFSITLSDFTAEYSKNLQHFLITSNTDNTVQTAYTIPADKKDFEIMLNKKQQQITDVMLFADSISFKLNGKESVLQKGIPSDLISTGTLFLYIAQEAKQVVSFQSTIVLSAQNNTKTCTIDWFNPIYFKGYMLYQTFYTENNDYRSSITIKSDWGKYLSLLGAIIMCLGLFMRCAVLFFKPEAAHAQTISKE